MAISCKEHTTGRHYKSPEVKLIGDRAVRFRDVKVHEFRMSDIEDPDLFAAQPLAEWADSEAGKWCIENAEEVPYWVRQNDLSTYGYAYAVMARLSEQNEVFFNLKFKAVTR
jgi:hypothetical protein